MFILVQPQGLYPVQGYGYGWLVWMVSLEADTLPCWIEEGGRGSSRFNPRLGDRIAQKAHHPRESGGRKTKFYRSILVEF